MEFCFLTFRFNQQNLTLIDQATNQTISLSEQSAKLLTVLLSNSDTAMSKAFLINQAWAKPVAESLLIKELSLLRKAIGDDPLKPKVICSQPGNGKIEFNAKVTIQDSDSESLPATTYKKVSLVLIAFIAASLLWYLTNAFNYNSALEGNSIAPRQSPNTNWYLYRFKHPNTDNQYRLYLHSQRLMKPTLADLTPISSSDNYQLAIWNNKSQVVSVKQTAQGCQIVLTIITTSNNKNINWQESVVEPCLFGVETRLSLSAKGEVIQQK